MSLQNKVRWVLRSWLWEKQRSTVHIPVLPLADLRVWLERENHTCPTVQSILAELDALEKEAKT